MKLHMYMLEASIESVSMFEWRAATLAPMCSFHSFLVLLKVIGAKKVLYFFTGFFSAYKKIAVFCGKKLHNSYWNNATCFKLLPFHLKKFYRLVFLELTDMFLVSLLNLLTHSAGLSTNLYSNHQCLSLDWFQIKLKHQLLLWKVRVFFSSDFPLFLWQRKTEKDWKHFQNKA